MRCSLRSSLIWVATYKKFLIGSIILTVIHWSSPLCAMWISRHELQEAAYEGDVKGVKDFLEKIFKGYSHEEKREMIATTLQLNY